MSVIVLNLGGQPRGRRSRLGAVGRSVFVDESGRRRRYVRLLLLAAAVLSVAPLVAVLLSVVGGVGLPALRDPVALNPHRQTALQRNGSAATARPAHRRADQPTRPEPPGRPQNLSSR